MKNASKNNTEDPLNFYAICDPQHADNVRTVAIWFDHKLCEVYVTERISTAVHLPGLWSRLSPCCTTWWLVKIRHSVWGGGKTSNGRRLLHSHMQRNSPGEALGRPVVLRPVRATPCLNKILWVGLRKSYCWRQIGDLTKCCKMFTFRCPTSWRPEQLA